MLNKIAISLIACLAITAFAKFFVGVHSVVACDGYHTMFYMMNGVALLIPFAVITNLLGGWRGAAFSMAPAYFITQIYGSYAFCGQFSINDFLLITIGTLTITLLPIIIKKIKPTWKVKVRR